MFDLTLLLIFISGLCVGSFLNVLIYREGTEDGLAGPKRGQKQAWLPSWALGRSYCDHCRKSLNWYDNIPLLSYLLLRGRCRFCGKPISWQYPLVEFLTGIEFIWIYFLITSNLDFFSHFEGFYSFLLLVLWIIVGSSLLAIFIADIRYQIIPDSAIYMGLLAALTKLFVDYRYTGMVDFTILWSSLGAGLFFLILVLLTRGKGMGVGDVKFGILMGMILGWPNILLALMFAFLTGAAVGVILIITKRKGLKSKIAFGPFLVMGTLFSLFYGQIIWLKLFP